MKQLTVIWWRDIPSQVIAKSGRANAKRMLAERFQEAIDSAAMRAGAGTTDDYLADWRRDGEPLPEGDLQAIVDARVEELEAAHDEATLKAITKNSGYKA